MNVPEAIIKEATSVAQVYCQKNHLQGRSVNMENMENVQVCRFVFY
jgi:hypothetical protein